MPSMTYGQIRDFVYHRLFQNTSTEVFTDNDVAFAINIAQHEIVSRISHPLLLSDFVKTLSALGTTFEYDYNIKKINKVIGFPTSDTSNDSDGTELSQVFYSPVPSSIGGVYEYNSINNVIKTGDEFLAIKVYGERFLAEIDSSDDSWSTVFPLGITIAGVVAENVMAQLIPANITEGYNLAQYHSSVYERMINRVSQSIGAIVGEKNIKNKVI